MTLKSILELSAKETLSDYVTANPNTHELIHVQSGRSWRQWENQWHRQHPCPDGLRFEIAEALDRLYRKGYRATQIIIAHRYQEPLASSLTNHSVVSAFLFCSIPALWSACGIQSRFLSRTSLANRQF